MLERAPQGSGGLDLLAGGLDELGIPLTDDDLLEQLLLLLFAGYETTASSLSYLMRALLLEPEVERWLRQELETLPWPPEAETASSAYDTQRAPRLDALVQEVLRLTSPVGGFFRRITRPLTLTGVAVPAGRVVQVALAASKRYASDRAAGTQQRRRLREPGSGNVPAPASPGGSHRHHAPALRRRGAGVPGQGLGRAGDPADGGGPAAPAAAAADRGSAPGPAVAAESRSPR